MRALGLVIFAIGHAGITAGFVRADVGDFAIMVSALCLALGALLATRPKG